MDLVRLSKTISRALRHEPWVFELELDAEGWTAIADLIAALRLERDEWAGLSPADLERVNVNNSKQRFEIVGDRIRALYGHSIPGRLEKTRAAPPDVLYHGTSPSALDAIRASGLLPMRRQYVHLSVDRAMAITVGQRKASRPIILEIAARSAHDQGSPFYIGNDKVWLAETVPPAFINIPPT